jgi:HEAT repeat protein
MHHCRVAKKRIVLAAAVAMALACAIGLNPDRRQAHYAGRSVRDWFTQYTEGMYRFGFDDDRFAEASVALKHLGTSALPFLIHEAFTPRRDPAWRLKLRVVFNELPRSFGLPALISWADVRNAAVSAISELKPPARDILPELEKRLASANPEERINAIRLLAKLGDGAEMAVPFLTNVLHDPNDGQRVMALYALRSIGFHAGAAIPALIPAVETNSPGSQESFAAALALGAIGSNAFPALPSIRGLYVHEMNAMRKISLATALLQIDSGQSDALRYLMTLATNADNNKDRRRDAFLACSGIARIGPTAQLAMPGLLDVLGDPAEIGSLGPFYALKQLGVSNELIMAKIAPALRSSDDSVRQAAALETLLVDSRNSSAQLALLNLISSNSTLRISSLEALAGSGSGASNTVPTLRRMIPMLPEDVRARVASVIHRIGFMAWVEEDDRRRKDLEMKR